MHLGAVIDKQSGIAIQFWFNIKDENSFISNYLNAIKIITSKTIQIYNPNFFNDYLKKDSDNYNMINSYLETTINKTINKEKFTQEKKETEEKIVQEVINKNIFLTRNKILLFIFSESTFKDIIKLFYHSFNDLINISNNIQQLNNKQDDGLKNNPLDVNTINFDENFGEIRNIYEMIYKNFSTSSLEICLSDFLQIKKKSGKNNDNFLNNIHNLFYYNDTFYLKILYNLLFYTDNSIKNKKSDKKLYISDYKTVSNNKKLDSISNIFILNNTLKNHKNINNLSLKLNNFIKNNNFIRNNEELMKVINFSTVGDSIVLWCKSNNYDLPILTENNFIAYSHKLKKVRPILDESFENILKLFDIQFPIQFEEPCLQLIHQNLSYKILNCQ